MGIQALKRLWWKRNDGFGTHNAMGVMLAQKWDEGIDPTGWLASEKVDGVRALWDGTALWTRNGNKIDAPEWFTKKLPVHVWLDGELNMGRGTFQRASGVVRAGQKDAEGWKKMRLTVFDAPNQSGGYVKRMEMGAGCK